MAVIEAALCEDEAGVAERLSRALEQEFARQGERCAIEVFPSAEALLDVLRDGRRFSAYFLDIEMPGMNGIDLCRKIRSSAPAEDELVVFVSNKEELVFQSLEVRPFRFVRKSHFAEELPATVRSMVHELGRSEGTFVTIEELNSSRVLSVNARELVYAEVRGKFCHLMTLRGEVVVRYRLADLEARLAGLGFLKPHRSYLVNYRYVWSIGRDAVTLDDRREVPLSRNRVDAVKQEFLRLSRGDA